MSVCVLDASVVTSQTYWMYRGIGIGTWNKKSTSIFGMIHDMDITHAAVTC